MTLTITPAGKGDSGFDVYVNHPRPPGMYDDPPEDVWQLGLTPDEALWVAAQFLMGKKHRYLKSEAEHKAWSERR